MKEICVKVTGCKELTITDNYNWEDIIPENVVTSTVITIKYISSTFTSDVITVLNANEYVKTTTVLAKNIISSWTKIEDGYFQIKITYLLNNESTVKTYIEVFNKCNIQCKLDNLIADYIEQSPCDSCGEKEEKDILDLALKSELLCYAITCSSKSKVWELYNYINNMLTDYNCKSC